MVKMSAPTPPPVPQLPAAPPPAPVFGQAPTGEKPKAKSMTPSFLNTSASPSPSQTGGGKTLTGQ